MSLVLHIDSRKEFYFCLPHNVSDNISPAFVLPESPPIQQPQGRGRKRKQFFDENIVLKNK